MLTAQNVSHWQVTFETFFPAACCHLTAGWTLQGLQTLALPDGIAAPINSTATVINVRVTDDLRAYTGAASGGTLAIEGVLPMRCALSHMYIRRSQATACTLGEVYKWWLLVL